MRFMVFVARKTSYEILFIWKYAMIFISNWINIAVNNINVFEKPRCGDRDNLLMAFSARLIQLQSLYRCLEYRKKSRHFPAIERRPEFYQ